MAGSPKGSYGLPVHPVKTAMRVQRLENAAPSLPEQRLLSSKSSSLKQLLNAQLEPWLGVT